MATSLSNVYFGDVANNEWHRKGAADIAGSAVGSFVLGVTEPTAVTTEGAASNVGLKGVTPTGGTLTGDQVITTAGTTISNKIINGRVIIQAANVTISGCQINGSSAGYSSDTGLVVCTDAAVVNAVIQDCDICPQTPSTYIDGIRGHGFTSLRNYIWHTVDGIGCYSTSGDNVLIAGTYVDYLYYYSPDPEHSDNRTHNDGIQVQGGDGHQIYGNKLYTRASGIEGNAFPGASPAPIASNPYYPSNTGSSIAVTPSVAAITGLDAHNNWLDYGAQSVTVIPGNYGTSAVVGRIYNNIFGGHNPLITKSSPDVSPYSNNQKRMMLIHYALTVTNQLNNAASSESSYSDPDGNVDSLGTAITVFRMIG